MKEIKNCAFCGKSEFVNLFNCGDKNYHVPGKFKLVKCKNCGLIFINPQPSFKELGKYYPSKYYSLDKIDTGKKSKMRIFFYELYYNSGNKRLISKIFFSPFKPYIRGTKIIKNAKILDVGCGSGKFLYEMKKFGMDVYGVEPGNFNKEEAKKYGLNIKNVDLMKAKYPSNYFDIITINHVLEHVNNPTETLQEIYRILKKGGTLIIGVPNSRSLGYRVFGKNWLPLDVPRHLFDYFDKLLKEQLKINGFKVDKIIYNSRPDLFSVSLMYFLNIKPRKHGVLSKILNFLFLPLTYLVNFLKMGDQIEIYCEK